MAKGLWDDIPLKNIDRDKAWETFIKRKDVKTLFEMEEGSDFKFPLGGAYYAVSYTHLTLPTKA